MRMRSRGRALRACPWLPSSAAPRPLGRCAAGSREVLHRVLDLRNSAITRRALSCTPISVRPVAPQYGETRSARRPWPQRGEKRSAESVAAARNERPQRRRRAQKIARGERERSERGTPGSPKYERSALKGRQRAHKRLLANPEILSKICDTLLRR
jgi:hypothetical protein